MGEELKSSLNREEIHFKQDEKKKQTYHRTGAWVEVPSDPDDVFANVMVGVFLFYIGGRLVLGWIGG